MNYRSNKPTDRRSQRRREQRRLFWIVLAFLVVAGSAAIGLAYGWRAVFLGLGCLLVGAAVLGLLWLILAALERAAD